MLTRARSNKIICTKPERGIRQAGMINQCPRGTISRPRLCRVCPPDLRHKAQDSRGYKHKTLFPSPYFTHGVEIQATAR